MVFSLEGGIFMPANIKSYRGGRVHFIGVGVMIATSEPQVKRVEGARSLLVLEGFEPDTGRAIIHPSKAYL